MKRLLHPTLDISRLEMPRLGLPAFRLRILVRSVFVLLALAITSANPRAGKSTSLAVALLAFVVYYNLMTVGQSWVVSGRMSMLGFLLGLLVNRR